MSKLTITNNTQSKYLVPSPVSKNLNRGETKSFTGISLNAVNQSKAFLTAMLRGSITVVVSDDPTVPNVVESTSASDGLWTPNAIVSSGPGTIGSTDKSIYTRIGNSIMCSCRIRFQPTGSGSVIITMDAPVSSATAIGCGLWTPPSTSFATFGAPSIVGVTAGPPTQFSLAINALGAGSLLFTSVFVQYSLNP